MDLEIEVNCPLADVKAAFGAIRAIHPYDHPLINVVPLLNHQFDEQLDGGKVD